MATDNCVHHMVMKNLTDSFSASDTESLVAGYKVTKVLNHSNDYKKPASNI
jgi:hypothetical protein